MISRYEQEIDEEGDSYIIRLPKEWSGVEDGKVQIILNDLCIIAPASITEAAGEVVILKFIETMIDAGVVDSGDLQKALEHLV